MYEENQKQLGSRIGKHFEQQFEQCSTVFRSNDSKTNLECLHMQLCAIARNVLQSSASVYNCTQLRSFSRTLAQFSAIVRIFAQI